MGALELLSLSSARAAMRESIACAHGGPYQPQKNPRWAARVSKVCERLAAFRLHEAFELVLEA